MIVILINDLDSCNNFKEFNKLFNYNLYEHILCCNMEHKLKVMISISSRIHSIYILQAYMHVTFAGIITITHSIIDRIINSNQPQVSIKLQEFQYNLEIWMQNLSLMNPRLQILNVFGMISLVATIFFPISYNYLNSRTIKRQKLSMLYYGNSRKEGEVEINRKLDHIIESIMISINNYGHKQFLSRLLSEKELEGLMRDKKDILYFKNNKLSIWPANRLGSDWLKKPRKHFLSIYITSYIIIYIATLFTIFDYFRTVKNYNKENGQILEHSLLAKKYTFDLVIFSSRAADQISVSITTFLTQVADEIELLRIQKESLNKLIHINEALYLLKLKHQDIKRNICNKRKLLGLYCNRFCLEAYIRFSYFIETTKYLKSSGLFINLSLISLTISICGSFIPTKKPEPAEHRIIILNFITFLLAVDMVLLGASYYESYCRKEFHRLINIVSVIIMESFDVNTNDKSINYGSKTTIHTFLLWHKFILQEREFIRGFAFKLLNSYRLGYSSLLRCNLLASYIVALTLISRYQKV